MIVEKKGQAKGEVIAESGIIHVHVEYEFSNNHKFVAQMMSSVIGSHRKVQQTKGDAVGVYECMNERRALHMGC